MPDLNAIVQRMIDADESEENIAIVIREFKSAAATKPAGETDASGNRIVRNPDGSIKFMQGPGFRGDLRGRPDSNMATIGGVGITPEDALMVPTLAKGVTALARGAGRAVSAARGPAASALDLTSAALDNPIVGTVSPRAGQAGKLLGAAADFIRPKATAAVPAVAEAVAEAAPAVAKAAPYAPNVALKAAKEAFAAVGEAPLKAEASNAMELIRRGKSPEEAIRIVMGNRPVAAVAAVAETPAKLAQTVNKLPSAVKLTAEEVRVGMDLMARGKSPQEVLEIIQAQRAFKTIPGVQSSAEARAALDLRNAQGKIKTPSAETARAAKAAGSDPRNTPTQPPPLTDLVARKEAEIVARSAGKVPSARLSIKPATYGGTDGFSVIGRDAEGRSVSMFAKTRAIAERIKAKKLAGLDINAVDFAP